MATRRAHSCWEWKVGLLTLAVLFLLMGALDLVTYGDFGLAIVAFGGGIASVVVVIVSEGVRRRSTDSDQFL